MAVTLHQPDGQALVAIDADLGADGIGSVAARLISLLAAAERQRPPLGPGSVTVAGDDVEVDVTAGHPDLARWAGVDRCLVYQPVGAASWATDRPAGRWSTTVIGGPDPAVVTPADADGPDGRVEAIQVGAGNRVLVPPVATVAVRTGDVVAVIDRNAGLLAVDRGQATVWVTAWLNMAGGTARADDIDAVASLASQAGRAGLVVNCQAGRAGTVRAAVAGPAAALEEATRSGWWREATGSPHVISRLLPPR